MTARGRSRSVRRGGGRRRCSWIRQVQDGQGEETESSSETSSEEGESLIRRFDSIHFGDVGFPQSVLLSRAMSFSSQHSLERLLSDLEASEKICTRKYLTDFSTREDRY